MPQAISIESDGSDLPEGEFMFQGAILSTSIVRITKSGGGGRSIQSQVVNPQLSQQQRFIPFLKEQFYMYKH